MYLKALFFTILLTLAACSGCAGLNERQQIAIACQSASTALDTLTTAKQAGKISGEQLTDAIRVYEAGVVPLCVPVAEDLTAAQRAALNAAIAELTRRAAETKR